jgi:hypothetical protein
MKEGNGERRMWEKEIKRWEKMEKWNNGREEKIKRRERGEICGDRIWGFPDWADEKKEKEKNGIRIYEEKYGIKLMMMRKLGSMVEKQRN